MLTQHRSKKIIIKLCTQFFLTLTLSLFTHKLSFSQTKNYNPKIIISGIERVEESTILQHFNNIKFDKNIKITLEDIKKIFWKLSYSKKLKSLIKTMKFKL